MRRLGAAAALCLLSAPALAAGGGAGAPVADPDTDGAGASSALVRLDDVVIVPVVGVASFAAEERARHIEDRLLAIARDREVPATAIAISESEHGPVLGVGDRRILVVTDADAAHARMPRATMAQAVRERLIDAVERYRAARTPRALARAGGVAAASLLVAIVAIWLLNLGRRNLQRRLHARYVRDGLRFRSLELVGAQKIDRVVRGVLGGIEAALVAVIAVVAIQLALGSLPWTRPLAREVLPYLLAPLGSIAAGTWQALPGLVLVVVIVVLTTWFLKIARLVFGALGSGSVALRGFDPEWAMPTYGIVRLAAIAFAAVMSYPHIPGSETGAFKGVSILVGVLLSLGSSASVANVVSGYALVYLKPFRVGDRVRIGAAFGNVEEIGLIQTTLRTPKNELVVLPNSSIVAGQVMNYSALARSGELLLHTTVGIGYETPWRQVEAMLLLAAGRTPGLREVPEPFVLETALADFCITYELNVYCDDARELEDVYAALHRSVLDVFNEHGVQIMTPAYMADPAEPKVVPPERFYERPARPPDAAGEAPGAARAAGGERSAGPAKSR